MSILQIMDQQIAFQNEPNRDALADLKNEWLSTLTSPQDGMWESFRDNALHWGIMHDNEMIGYAAIGEGNQLIQFYITSKYHSTGEEIFRNFIDKLKINNGLVGTNNPGYLSIALNFTKDLKVHTCLFRDSNEVNIADKEGTLKLCQPEDLERIVKFCHFSMGAPTEWLTGYIGSLIEKKEIFYLEDAENIIGTCEIRKSLTSPEFADIGMVVSPDFRKQGYGTFLLNKAKTIAFESHKIPICSCEKDNVGSRKSIHNCGFVSMYQLLSISFN